MAKLGSAGRAPIFSEVRLVDPDGRDIATPRVNGEVITSGPNIMKGYWNNPEATAAAIDSEGWFHTGDVGYFDEDGFLFIADRLKDMVITGGENFATTREPRQVDGSELERALSAAAPR